MSYGYRLGSNRQMDTYNASLEVTEQKCIALLREQEEVLNKKAKSMEDEVIFVKKFNKTVLKVYFYRNVCNSWF